MARKNKKAGAAPLTSPQTREEMYLANIAGLVNTKPEYPFTRTERYLDAISSGTSGLADRVTALETDKVNVIGKGVNLLDNAYFIGGGTPGAFPVNQRYPQVSFPSGGFDRWSARVSDTTTAIYDNFITITDPASHKNWFVWGQSLESPQKFAGKTVTISALVSGVTGDKFNLAVRIQNGSSVVYQNGVLVDSAGLFKYTFTVPESSFDSFVVGFHHNNASGVSSTISVVAMKMELGSMQTLARQVNGAWVLNDPPPNYQQELAKCQRYLHIIKTDNAAGALIGSGYVNSGVSYKQILVTVYTPVTMNPITLLQTSGVGAISDGAIRELDAASIFAQAGNVITLDLTSNTAISTAFAPASAYIFNSGYVILSAE